jgi:LmbE family N-acetylglucosaminyl deacetylase
MQTDQLLERLCRSDEERPPSTLIVAAHPGDETLGAGARIACLCASCRVVFVTDGAPCDRRFFPRGNAHLSRAAYARKRLEEAVRALGLAGVEASRITSLHFRDQDAAFHMATIAERLAAIVVTVRPAVVLTHAYEGGHPDHDATAFAVHAALALVLALPRASSTLVEMTGYHDRCGMTVRGEFLPRPNVREITLPLSEFERQHKRSMLAAYVTQREVLAPFKIETERFRRAPRYDFGVPPLESRLHYERFGLGIGGPMWRALARAATRKLTVGRDRSRPGEPASSST